MYYPEKECSKLVKRIEKKCEQKGISKYALAKKANLSTSTIHSIFNGKSNPQIYTLFQICNALEMPIDEIFDKENLYEDGDSKKPEIENDPQKEQKAGRGVDGLSQEEKEFLEFCRRLPEKKKEWLRSCIEILR